MEAVGEFFATIPEAMRALWEFGEGWHGLMVTLGSIVLLALFAAGAHRFRETLGWVSAVLGTFAAFILGFWLFAILPSAWVFFVDSERPLLEGTLLPEEIIIGDLEVMTDAYLVFRDSVVMLETVVAMAFAAYLAVWIQRRYPRGLAPNEEKSPSTGGYK